MSLFLKLFLVLLGNVLNAKAAKEKITFIREEDLKLFEKLRGEAFEVQVGLHELLGWCFLALLCR